MGLTKELITDALRGVDLPAGGDLVSSGALTWVAACDGYANLRVHLKDADERRMTQLASVIDATVRAEADAAGITVERLGIEFVDHSGTVVHRVGAPPTDDMRPPEQGGDAPAPALAKRIIAVGAGKGGVGKSTVAVSLAVGLARTGRAVGLLDGDIYGPSLPTMLGLDALEQSAIDGKLQPFLVHGVKAVTIGKMVEPDKPLIWRGPMAHGAFKQLFERTSWGELDDLIIDLPPGTGDVPLTMAQSLSLTGAVVVCTPQKVAQDDAVRAVRMFQQLGVEVLGVVENMSYFIGDPDSDGNVKTYDLFGRGGAERMAQRLGLPFLGAVPINTALRQNLDSGEPSKCFEAAHAGGEALPKSLEAMVKNLDAQATLADMRTSKSRPTLSIS